MAACKPRVADPLAKRLVGVAQQLVQIAHRDAAACAPSSPGPDRGRRYGGAQSFRSAPDGPCAPSNCPRSAPVHPTGSPAPEDRPTAGPRWRGFLRSSRHSAPGSGGPCRRTARSRHWWHRTAGCRTGPAHGCGRPAVLGQLHHPQIGRFGVAELIGLVAAFDEEGAGVGAHFLAALGEAQFGAGRNVTRNSSGPGSRKCLGRRR